MTRYWGHRSGNVATILALAIIPMAALAGFSIDARRLDLARSRAQDVADSAALAAAINRDSDQDRTRRQVRSFVEEQLDRPSGRRSDVDVRFGDGREITVAIRGSERMIFGGLIGRETMGYEVNATTQRGSADAVEVALVLDNTWSMSDVDARGARKIDALKTAAEQLVTTVAGDGRDDVRFALVPYGEYVNVGTGHRNASWLSVGADYSTTTPAQPRTCRTHTTRQVCTGGVRGTCTRNVDGVPETYSCWTTPQTCRTETVAPYEVCTGGGSGNTTWYRWFGCVASRNVGDLRLDDTQPAQRYPGLLQTSQTCLRPLVPLTADTPRVRAAIRDLVVNQGGHRPQTYIPAGMIWGVNLLSNSAPFTEGRAYDPNNARPRKILVLMSDGDNTLRFNRPDGRHLTGNSGQYRETDRDTLAICDYAKARGIEVYSVALAVTSAHGRNTMERCATRRENYFDARDTAEMSQAFAEIAASINRVRLVR